MRRTERPFTQLPIFLLIAFVVVFGLQIGAHHAATLKTQLKYQPLTTPLPAYLYKNMAMGSGHLLSYLLAIRLQLHDNQAGKHIRYDKIDYTRLVTWLKLIDSINQQSEYPMMLASRVYSQTRDKTRLRLLLEYIQGQFKINPQLHWRRLAEAAVIAKHQLGDMQLALRFAADLADQPESIIMPRWARDIRFLVLAELNEYESAIAIISALLKSGSVTDPDENRFLQEKLSSYRQKLSESQQ